MGSRFCLYGYKVSNNEYLINEDEAKVVISVFEKYLSGFSLKKIADELTVHKVKYYKEKNTWNKNMVSRIIENQHYTGDETYPKIIDESIYSQAVAMKINKGGTREKDTKEMKFIKSHIFCSVCGEKYVRKMITRNNREKWFCSCLCKTRRYIDDEVLFDEILNLINAVIYKPSLVEKRIYETKSYNPDIEMIRKENELGYMIEQNAKDFKDLAKDLLSVASEKFDFYSDVIDKEYIGAFVDYLKSSECVDKIEYNLLFDVVDKIFINANGTISIKFVNNAMLCYEEGEYKNVAC